jgi:hypothetical protein
VSRGLKTDAFTRLPPPAFYHSSCADSRPGVLGVSVGRGRSQAAGHRPVAPAGTIPGDLSGPRLQGAWPPVGSERECRCSPTSEWGAPRSHATGPYRWVQSTNRKDGQDASLPVPSATALCRSNGVAPTLGAASALRRGRRNKAPRPARAPPAVPSHSPVRGRPPIRERTGLAPPRTPIPHSPVPGKRRRLAWLHSYRSLFLAPPLHRPGRLPLSYGVLMPFPSPPSPRSHALCGMLYLSDEEAVPGPERVAGPGNPCVNSAPTQHGAPGPVPAGGWLRPYL